MGVYAGPLEAVTGGDLRCALPGALPTRREATRIARPANGSRGRKQFQAKFRRKIVRKFFTSIPQMFMENTSTELGREDTMW